MRKATSVTPPTIRDVAKHAGVSYATVSRVLNDSPKVSPAARKRVRQAIRETGFRVNPSARSLATGRAGAIAFVVTQSVKHFFTDPTFAILLQAVTNEARQLGYALILLMPKIGEGIDESIHFLQSQHVDGILLATPQLDDPFLKAFGDTSIPIVACGSVNDPRGQVARVEIDDFGGAAKVGALFKSLNRQYPVHISGPGETGGGRHRLEGFEAGWGNPLPDFAIEVGDYLYESGRLAMQRLLDRYPQVDAVFAASDSMARGALSVLAAAGKSVPSEVAVVGFDDHAIATQMYPHLTTVRQHIDEVGVRSAQMLHDLIEGGSAQTCVLPVELVRRDTA